MPRSHLHGADGVVLKGNHSASHSETVLRIAMLISRFPPYIGGTEIQCLRLSQRLAARGNRVSVLTEKPGSIKATSGANDGIEVLRFATLGTPPIGSLLYAFKSLLHLLAHRGFDVLHAHMIAVPAFVAIIAGKLLRIPVLVKVAGGRKTGEVGRAPQSTGGRLKLALFKKAAPFVVCPSKETLAELKAMGLPPKRLNYIPNGVDASHFKPLAKENMASLRRNLSLPSDRRIAIYTGRWFHGKRLEALLAAWAEGLQRRDWQWDLLLVLAGPLSRDQKLQLDKLAAHVHLRENIGDCLPYYQAGDLAVLISEGEGLSNFLLEAMACGLPTLTTEAAAITNVPERDTWGYVIEDETSLVQHIVAHLDRLQRDPEELRAKGERARRMVEERYSLDRIASLYESLYAQMIGSKT